VRREQSAALALIVILVVAQGTVGARKPRDVFDLNVLPVKCDRRIKSERLIAFLGEAAAYVHHNLRVDPDFASAGSRLNAG
jgi:hypothetical protein